MEFYADFQIIFHTQQKYIVTVIPLELYRAPFLGYQWHSSNIHMITYRVYSFCRMVTDNSPATSSMIVIQRAVKIHIYIWYEHCVLAFIGWCYLSVD